MRFIVKLFIGLLISSSAAFAGGVDPFPFGKEIKFPWKMLPGTWSVEDSSTDNVFNFKVSTNSKGDKEVQIMLVNPNYCYVIAQGKGVLNGKYISAQMVSNGKTFNLTVHAFNSADVTGTNINTNLRSSGTSDKVVMALTIYKVGDMEHRSSYEITKIGALTDSVCR
jgi:hypothetical protein